MEKVRLGEYISILSGFAFKSALFSSDNTFTPIIRIRDIKRGFSETFYNGDFKKEYIVNSGELLIGMDGEFNAVLWTGIPSLLNQRVCKITSNNENLLVTKYLYYGINEKLKEIEDRTSFVTVKHLSINDINSIEIPLPSLSIQKEIAAKLDKSDEIRRINQQLIAKYDELTQSLFFDMFGDPVKNEKGWENVKLGDVCKVGSSRRVFVDELVENGIPFYRGTEIGALGNSEEIKPTLFIKKEHYIHLKKETGVPSIGDLLMPSICPDGRIFEVKDNNPFYFKDGRVLWIKIDKENVNSVYLKKFLKQLFATNYSKIASGTTFAELKIFALNDLTILFPPISLQNQFSERVQAIEAQKQLAQDALAKSETLFQSLLQESFKD